MSDKHDHGRMNEEINGFLRNLAKGAKNFTQEEREKMSGVQQPDAFLICCIDSRFQPDRALDYGPGVALEYRPIAAAIPPQDQADDALLGRMAFRRLKEVKNIVIVAHSDCGGAQASIQIPEPDVKNGGDLDLVAAQTHRTGLDVPKLRDEFLKATKGDTKEAGNMLAKATAVQSLKNILGYKGRDGFSTIEDEMKAGEVNVVLLYYDLETQKAEKYDLAKGQWGPLAPAADKKAKPPQPPKIAA